MASEQIWTKDPSVLVCPPRSLFRVWPFVPAQMQRTAKYNAASRTALIVGLIGAVWMRRLTPALAGLGVALAIGMYHVWCSSKRRQSAPQLRAPARTQQSYEHGPSGQTVQTGQMRQMQAVQEAVEALDTRQDAKSVPLAFEGSLGTMFPADYRPSTYPHNPHDNPGPFDYDRAVRSSAPKPTVRQENMLARLYSTPDQIPFDLVTNPVPDPTFMARHPFWDESSEADRHIVQDQCNMRVCR